MVVLDSSTLILLAKTELLDAFIEGFPGKIFVPESVEEESTKKSSFDSLLIGKRIKEEKIRVKKVNDVKIVKKLEQDFGLHKGEAEAIALCLENKFRLVGTDDYDAMKACRILRIKFVSAISILLKLENNQVLNKKEARLKLEKLSFLGRYSDEIIKEAEKNLR